MEELKSDDSQYSPPVKTLEQNYQNVPLKKHSMPAAKNLEAKARF
jgi:hypothetical protein